MPCIEMIDLKFLADEGMIERTNISGSDYLADDLRKHTAEVLNELLVWSNALQTSNFRRPASCFTLESRGLVKCLRVLISDAVDRGFV